MKAPCLNFSFFFWIFLNETLWQAVLLCLLLLFLYGDNYNIRCNLTDAEALILGPPDAKSQLIGKDPDAGENGGQEEKGTTRDAMFGWHHWLNGCEFEQTLGDSEGQGSLACCSPWVTESQIQFSNWTTKILINTPSGIDVNKNTLPNNLLWKCWSFSGHLKCHLIVLGRWQ